MKVGRSSGVRLARIGPQPSSGLRRSTRRMAFALSRRSLTFSRSSAIAVCSAGVHHRLTSRTRGNVTGRSTLALAFTSARHANRERCSVSTSGSSAMSLRRLGSGSATAPTAAEEDEDDDDDDEAVATGGPPAPRPNAISTATSMAETSAVIGQEIMLKTSDASPPLGADDVAPVPGD